MQMQMMNPMQPMQQMQPRLVLQQAVLKQPAVLSHARPAQPWLGQVHQLGQLNPARPMAMPVAMPTPIVKAVVKPGPGHCVGFMLPLCSATKSTKDAPIRWSSDAKSLWRRR